MADPSSWNEKIITEFRENAGRVGGPFEGAPVVLVHHEGRKTGRDYVTPLMYLADDDDEGTIYIFATAGGAPKNPDWYYNLVDAGRSTVERGSDTYETVVTELTGDARDVVYAEQAGRYEGFGQYAEQTAGIRTIPVLRLRRGR